MSRRESRGARVHIPTGGLERAEVAATAEWIAAVQGPDGMIPWYAGGHADPWNHVEAAMALGVAGRRREAEAAYEWLVARQHADGSWCSYYQARGVEEPRRDTNMCAYVATGVWMHYLATTDRGFLESMWGAVSRAVGFVLAQQRAGGEIPWSVDADGRPARDALLAASSSIRLSLRCAVAAAGELGLDRPAWELAGARLGEAISARPSVFGAKGRWSMDWYYPVLAGGIEGRPATQRMAARWDELVIDGAGVRCVSDQDWVTTAETAECAMALSRVGRFADAARLVEWTRRLRQADGSYWTGAVHPAGEHFPAGERSTYSAAAVILASSPLAARLFAGPDPAQDPEAPAGAGLLESA